MKIGVTGGIGSGKTTVINILSKMNYPIYIADNEARRLMHTDSRIIDGLVDNFGKEIYNSDKSLNKDLLASLIFRDKRALETVNSVVHPVVLEDFNIWTSKQCADIVFFESAIIFECSWEKYFDKIICIYASVEERVRRVMNRDNISESKVYERISNQMSDSVRIEKSDYSISTDEGNLVLDQILEILNDIMI